MGGEGARRWFSQVFHGAPRWNPLRTLAGQLIVVTIIAIVVSHAAAFTLFANERGRTLRKVASQYVAERVVYVAQRLRTAPPAQRSAMVEGLRDFGIRYRLSNTPDAARTTGDTATQVAAMISEDLGGADVRVTMRIVTSQPRAWRMLHPGPGDGRPGPPPGDAPQGPPPNGASPGGAPPNSAQLDRFNIVTMPDDGDAPPPPTIESMDRRAMGMARHGGPNFQETEITMAIPLGQGDWLNARSRLPAPRPLPLNIFFAGFASILAIGVGAVLIARQIGQPLADLAHAADRLGVGETNVAIVARGPDDLRRASTAFNTMADRLGRQMARQRQMLWALSHDLRTPITALRLRAELVEDEATKQRLLAPLAEMEALTEQALALARAGASQEAREQVDIAEIARTLCGELAEMGVTIRADAPVPVMASCRPNEIARALRNLAENASKYGGGGVMAVQRGDRGAAIIEVRDDGPGLTPDALKRVTEPFYRADAARSGDGGAGLGLAIVQAIADGHGGRLELENRTPHGLTARLILPA